MDLFCFMGYEVAMSNDDRDRLLRIRNEQVVLLAVLVLILIVALFLRGGYDIQSVGPTILP